MDDIKENVQPEHNGYQWDASRFRYLLERTGLSVREFSHQSGITKAAAISYTRNTMPGYTALCKIADFFNVPLDYLAGRCSLNEELLVKENFYQWYAEKERSLFEQKYLSMTVSKAVIPSNEREPRLPLDGVKLFWPYNLVHDVQKARGMEVAITVSTDDQLNGIEKALEILEERDRRIVISRYKDGRTQEDIAKEWGLTRERVRQVLVKSCTQLAVAEPFELICYGLIGSRCIQKQKELEKVERKLDSIIKASQNAICSNGVMSASEIEDAKKQGSLIKKDVEKAYDRECKITLDDLHLSARARNALKRNGALTIDAIIFMADSGRLANFANVGEKTVDEIEKVIAEYR